MKQNIKFNSSYFITSTVVAWIDLFSRKELREILIDSLKYCIQNKGLNVYSYCIMTNHIHIIVNCNVPFQLSDVIRDFKRHTSTACFNWIQNHPESRREWMTDIFVKEGKNDPKNKSIKIWQSGNHAIELFNPNFTWAKVRYIHNNPVRAEFVSKPEDWRYSSASNYLDLPSVLPEVIRILPPINFGMK